MPLVAVPLAGSTLTVLGSRGASVVVVVCATVVVVVALGAVVPVVPIVTELSAEWRSPTPMRKATTSSTAARPVWTAAERLNEPSSAAWVPRFIAPAALRPGGLRNGLDAGDHAGA